MASEQPKPIYLRDAIGEYSPTPKELETVKKLAKEITDRTISTIDENPQEIRAEILNYKKEKYNGQVTRPRLALDFSYGTLPPYLNQLVMENVGHKADYIAWFDIKYGFEVAMGALMGALDEIEGNDEVMSEEVIAKWVEDGIDFDGQIKMYLDSKKERSYYASLLTKAGSADKFLFNFLEDFREKPNKEGLPKLITYEVPEYVEIGIGMAANVYSRIFELTP